jgi:putative transposase
MSITFIDQHRATYGVEPICRVLPIAPSTYFRRARATRLRDGLRAPTRDPPTHGLEESISSIETFGRS